jgi:endonuclease-3
VGRLDIREVVAELAALHPLPEPLTDPFQILVWENVGYLVDEEVREALFAELGRRAGLDAKSIASAPAELLTGVCRRGGIHGDKRAARLSQIAALIADAWGGDLTAALRAMPVAKARALLKSLPSVGDPGADRILLFGGFAEVPALDSNGLRAMVRMGFCQEKPSYSTTYRDAVGVLGKQGEPGRDWLMTAWQALRQHGRILCKRSAPLCLACPLDAACAHAVTSQL